MSNALTTIDLAQLSTVTGGQGGTFERLGGAAGETLGRWGAKLLPQPAQPIGNAVLPPAGRAVGEYAGRAVDNLTNGLPRVGR
ncbi:MAG TPA: hypothetical protein VFQ53_20335 [Kofleriaceae bacterium]|nr:hypothetical protein [Kofleriaceae bacterium]